MGRFIVCRITINYPLVWRCTRDEVRLLESWGPYPIQPVVVRTDLDPALKVALRKSLIGTEDDPLTRLELEAFGLRRFAEVGEEDYDAGRLPQPLPGR
ncbi:hypothetical protein BH24ACT17_BH24ACT17_14190 [soil metagenome]